MVSEKLLIPLKHNFINRLFNAFPTLKELATVNFGMQLRNRKLFPSDVLTSPLPNELSKWHRRYLTGSDIERYYVKESTRYCFFNREAKKGGCWDEKVHFHKEKILVRQVGLTPIIGFDETGLPVLNTAFMIIPKNPEISSKFLLGVLNSSLISFLWLQRFADKRKTFPKIKGTYLEKLPIPILGDQHGFDTIVAKILFAKKQGKDSSTFEREIDTMVYKL